MSDRVGILSQPRDVNSSHLLDRRQYPRLSIVVSVGAYAEIDLLRILVCLVACCELEDSVKRDQEQFRRFGQLGLR